MGLSRKFFTESGCATSYLIDVKSSIIKILLSYDRISGAGFVKD
jgi:hypothetical protein